VPSCCVTSTEVRIGNTSARPVERSSGGRVDPGVSSTPLSAISMISARVAAANCWLRNGARRTRGRDEIDGSAASSPA
jgi:hypothetical protein